MSMATRAGTVQELAAKSALPCGGKPELAGQPANIDLKVQVIDRRSRQEPAQAWPDQLFEAQQLAFTKQLVVGTRAVYLRFGEVRPAHPEGRQICVDRLHDRLPESW